MDYDVLPAAWLQWPAERLELEVRLHNKQYWDQNAPTISDYDYDRLVRRLRELDPTSAVLDEMGPTRRHTPGEPVEHAQPMLSLDKAYDEKSLLHWSGKFDGELVMTPKVDGVACSIRYDAQGRLSVAATRGSGTVGENITQNVSRIIDVPERIPVEGGIEVRGEIYLPLSKFAQLDGTFANPRNTAAGALKQKNADRSAQVGLRFFLYDVLGSNAKTEIEKFALGTQWGFHSVEHRLVERHGVQDGYDDYVKRRDSLDFEIDGVVFKANRLDEQNRLGATAHHPRYAIAYKLQGDSASTVLKSVEWSVSRTGALTPVGIVEPVSLSGATVTRISLHNWGLVQAKNLSLNATVVAMRRGGVIPHLENVLEPGDEMIFPPAACPSCGTQPVIDGEFVVCPNQLGCPAQAVGNLAHYAKVTGIEGFGQVWLETLVDGGVLTSPIDFYTLERDALLGFERMGDTLARKLLSQIERSRALTLPTFLQALGIADLGKTASETIASSFLTLDSVRDLVPSQLEAIPGFGQLTAARICKGIAERSDMIDALLRHINVSVAEPPKKADGEFSGQSFLFTGTLTRMSRADAQAAVLERGGTAASGVSKNLSFLVVGDSGKAGSKLAKAQKAGIRVLSETEFFAMLEAASTPTP